MCLAGPLRTFGSLVCHCYALFLKSANPGLLAMKNLLLIFQIIERGNKGLCSFLKVNFAFKKLLLLHLNSFKSCYFFVPYWILLHRASLFGCWEKALFHRCHYIWGKDFKSHKTVSLQHIREPCNKRLMHNLASWQQKRRNLLKSQGKSILAWNNSVDDEVARKCLSFLEKVLR